MHDCLRIISEEIKAVMCLWNAPSQCESSPSQQVPLELCGERVRLAGPALFQSGVLFVQ